MRQVHDACTIVSIASVQNRYSVTDRRSEDVLEGTVSSTTSSSSLGFPWQPVNLPKRIVLICRVAYAKERDAFHKSLWHGFWRDLQSFCLIPGTSKVAHLVENVAAAGVGLTEDEINALNQILWLDP